MRSDSASLFCGYMDRQMKNLRAALPQVFQQWDVDAIHDARVATRRLKAATDVFREMVSAESAPAFRKVLRKLRRRLGPLRDADVMLMHLDDPGFGQGHGEACQWLRHRLVEQRDELRRQTAAKASAAEWLDRLDSWRSLRDELAKAEVDWSATLASMLRRRWADFRARAEQLATALDRGSSDGSEGAHGLRIAGKLLRYTLEMAGEIGLDVPQKLLRTFKGFQDALGLWHDFVVLSQRVAGEAAEETVALAAPRVYQELLALAQAAWARSRVELRQFVRLWREKGLAVGGRIEAIAASVCAAPAAEAGMSAKLREEQLQREVHDETLPGATRGGGESAGGGRTPAH